MPTTPALLVRDLSFAHPGGPAVTIDEWSVPAGGEVLLQGPSGSGKSTILQLLAGLLDAKSGRVEIDGEDLLAVRGAERDRRRGRRIGMIFQTFNLLSGFSARENAMLAMHFAGVPAAAHRERAADLLGSLGLSGNELDRPVDRLSVGQQQRVAVARALAAEPAIVLADEPTASLDPDNAARTVDLVREACRTRGAALLLTSHDPSLAERFENRIDVSTFVSLPSGAGS
ncbi:MAG: ATP-binding cassette domain-containing protein [Phycisphaerales bacterium]|jgi:putative ABC transport system ATP-binding protein|nr:ATP-binding cassette domain-containing protein [Planctomycetota bacterium]